MLDQYANASDLGLIMSNKLDGRRKQFTNYMSEYAKMTSSLDRERFDRAFEMFQSCQLPIDCKPASGFRADRRAKLLFRQGPEGSPSDADSKSS